MKTPAMISLPPPLRSPLPLALLALALAGCAVGPDYQRPDTPVPAHFQEAENWKLAEPADQLPRGPWWERFGDPQLNALVAQVAVNNQNVIAAEAQLRQAQGVLDANRASFFPTLSSGLTHTRAQGVSSSATNSASTVSTGGNRSINDTNRLSLSASWEADVWGRIRRSVESGETSAQASAADLAAALLSAQGTLAQTYLQWRQTMAQREILRATVAAYEKSLAITRSRYEAGVAAKSDVTQADTQLQTTRAQWVDLGIQAGQYEHAMALLVGKAPGSLQLTASPGLPPLPVVTPALPAQLLERRPDVAAAERRVAAANAQIGVAQAAFFPTLTLTGSGGYQNSGLAGLISQPNRYWSLGPALALTLFDAGNRAAVKDQAIAAYDKSVATYRQTVLTALQEVEDNLIALRLLADEQALQERALAAARENLGLIQDQYQAGTVSYLNVVSAQTAALSAETSKLNIEARRLTATAALYKALGGDWEGLPAIRTR